MISDRPYRRAIGVESALVELRRCAGTQFDPRVVDIFCSIVTAAAEGHDVFAEPEQDVADALPAALVEHPVR